MIFFLQQSMTFKRNNWDNIVWVSWFSPSSGWHQFAACDSARKPTQKRRGSISGVVNQLKQSKPTFEFQKNFRLRVGSCWLSINDNNKNTSWTYLFLLGTEKWQRMPSRCAFECVLSSRGRFWNRLNKIMLLGRFHISLLETFAVNYFLSEPLEAALVLQ